MVSFKGFAKDLGWKGKFGFIWLAATVGSSDRAVPKAKLLKIDLPATCADIRASAAIRRAPAVGAEEAEEEGGQEAEGEGEKGLGLRLSANLLLGVARVYDLQVHTASNDAVQVFLSLRPGFMDEFLVPAGAGAKGGRTGGGGGLDMVETAVNIDAVDEAEGVDDLALAFDLGPDAWEDLGYGSIPSWTTVPDEPSLAVEEEAEIGRAAAEVRRGFLPRPSSIGLRSPHLSEGELPLVLGLPAEPEFEGLDLGLDLGLGREGEEEDGGLGLGVGGRSSSVAAGGMDIDWGGGMGYEPEPGAFEHIPPAVGEDVEMLEHRPPEDEGVSPAEPGGRPLKPILKRPPANGASAAERKKRRKTVRLAVRDEALTYADEEIRDWRASYVERMVEQNEVQKKKADERAVRERADELLLGMPDVIGFQGHEMQEFFLEQQNRRRTFAPPASPAPAAAAPSDDEARRREAEFYQQQAMGGQPEEYGGGGMAYEPAHEGAGGFVEEFEVTLPHDVTREEGEDVELGRRAPSVERRVSLAPWELSSVGREPSIGLEGVRAPSSVGRPSSVPESDILAGRRPRLRASSRFSAERESVGALAGMEGEPLEEELLVIERESAVGTSATSATKAQEQFLAYLQTTLAGLPSPSPPSSPPAGVALAPSRPRAVPFSTLVPPDTCTPIVAAKGLYHVLVLATRGLIGVRQDECFGEILVEVREAHGAGGMAVEELEELPGSDV